MSGVPEYIDDVTGARVRMLVTGPDRDMLEYQTHPMWTPGMSHLMFSSNRPGGTVWAVRPDSGEARPVISGSANVLVLARKDDRLYFLRDRELLRTRLMEGFEGRGREEHIANLPEEVLSPDGGLTLDAKEDVLYAGAVLEKEKRWGLMALDLSSGAWRTVVEVDFRVGHLQANPFRAGQILFCWETGGDAPQRTWLVNADGSGIRPAYKESYDEWVTHEVWWERDRIIFTVWPYDEEHAQKPHGIVSANLEDGTSTVHTQYRAWHTHGSPDGRWAVGDDFERNLWLVEVPTGERRLLTQGHLGQGFGTHPHPSFTPDSRGVVFNSSRNGHEDIFLVELPEWDSLPPLKG